MADEDLCLDKEDMRHKIVVKDKIIAELEDKVRSQEEQLQELQQEATNPPLEESLSKGKPAFPALTSCISSNV